MFSTEFHWTKFFSHLKKLIILGVLISVTKNIVEFMSIVSRDVTQGQMNFKTWQVLT